MTPADYLYLSAGIALWIGLLVTGATILEGTSAGKRFAAWAIGWIERSR